MMFDMFCCSEKAEKAIPEEYRPIVDALFSSEHERPPALKNVERFARALGISTQFQHYLKSGDPLNESECFHKLLRRFQNNFDLLISKTWVSEDDIGRKNRLQDRLPAFISLIEGEKYADALQEYSEILEELAYLIFGNQSQKDDFAEYALRIDTQMGLFWYYGGQIGRLASRAAAAKKTKPAGFAPILIVGLCYLESL